MNPRQILSTLILNLLATSSFIAYALPSDNRQLLHISSQTLTINLTTQSAIYQGNVAASQGTRKMWGNQLTVKQNAQGQLQSVTTYGNPAKTQTLPKLNQPMVYGQAKRIIYLPQQDLLRYQTDAKVSQANNVFKGAFFDYNTQDRLISAPSSQAVPSTITLPPYDQNKLIKKS